MKESRAYGNDLGVFQAISNWLLELRPEFPAGALYMGLVMNEVAMVQGFLRALRFSLSVSQPVLNTFFLSNMRGMDNGFAAVVPSNTLSPYHKNKKK